MKNFYYKLLVYYLFCFDLILLFQFGPFGRVIIFTNSCSLPLWKEKKNMRYYYNQALLIVISHCPARGGGKKIFLHRFLKASYT